VVITHHHDVVCYAVHTTSSCGVLLQEELSDSAHCSLCVSLPTPAMAALQAPSGSPPDVSSRLLDICDVVDACEGLSIEAVVEAAYSLMHPGSLGEHQMLPAAQTC